MHRQSSVPEVIGYLKESKNVFSRLPGKIRSGELLVCCFTAEVQPDQRSEAGRGTAVADGQCS